MSLEIGKTYKLTFDVGGKALTFTGTILEDDDFITFRDKFDVELTYNKTKLVSYTEVQYE